MDKVSCIDQNCPGQQLQQLGLPLSMGMNLYLRKMTEDKA